MEYWVNPINPSFSRERFREGMDILMQAWTQPGPSRYDGEFYQYKYLNPFPLPYQKPHPKIYVVGSGTEETVNYAAEKGYGYSQVFTPIAGQLKSFENYRATATKNGQKHDSGSIIISAMAFVAETEEKAIEEGKEHILFYFKNLLKTDSHLNSPPGYLPVDRLRKRLQSGAGQETEVTWEGLTSVYRTALGAPDQVAERIAFWCEQAQSSRIILHLYVGDMPQWKAVKNITLFAEEVIPRVRKLTSSSRQEAHIFRAPGRSRIARIEDVFYQARCRGRWNSHPKSSRRGGGANNLFPWSRHDQRLSRSSSAVSVQKAHRTDPPRLRCFGRRRRNKFDAGLCGPL
jgi:luciferase-like monooxygenase